MSDDFELTTEEIKPQFNPDFEVETIPAIPPVESDFETLAQQIIDRSPRPEQTQEILKQATAIQGVTGLPWENAFNKASILATTKLPYPKKLGKAIVDRWKSEQLTVQIGQVGNEARKAYQRGDAEEYERLVKGYDSLVAALPSLEDTIPAYPDNILGKVAGFGRRMLTGAAGLIGMQVELIGGEREVERYYEAGKEGPLSFAYLKFASSHALQSIKGIGEVEAGAAFMDLVKLGVEPGIADLFAKGIGVINNALELTEIATFVKMFPGAEQVISKATSGLMRKLLLGPVMKNAALRLTTKLAVGVTQELAQEIAQEAVTFYGENWAVEIENAAKGTQLEGNKDFLGRVNALIKDFLPGLIGLGAIPMGFQAMKLGGEKVAAKPVATAIPAEAVAAKGGKGAAIETTMTQARRVLASPEGLDTAKAAVATKQLDAVIASAPESTEALRAAELADEIEKQVEIIPGVTAATQAEEDAALATIAGGLEQAPAQAVPPITVEQAQQAVFANKTVPDEQLETFRGQPWADDEFQARETLREEAVLAQTANMDVEEFVQEMKSVEAPGDEKPADYYVYQWKQAAAGKGINPDFLNRRFVQTLDKNYLETIIRDVAREAPFASKAFGLFAGDYKQMLIEKGLTKEHYENLLRKISMQPERYRRAIEESLSEEAATLHTQEVYEAGAAAQAEARAAGIPEVYVKTLGARLPKGPGEGLEGYRKLKVSDVMRQKENTELIPVRRRIARILKNALRPPSGAVSFDEGQQILALQSTIDARTGKRMITARERLKAYYDTHPDQIPSPEQREFLEKRYLGDMTYGDLEDFDKQVRDLRQVGRTKRTLALLEEQKIVAKAQTKIVAEIAGHFEKTPAKGSLQAERKLAGGVGRKIQANTLSMLRLARMLGSTSDKWLTSEVNKVTDEELRAIDVLVEPAKAKMKELGITPRRLSEKLATEDGIQYRRDDVIHMYIAMRNEDERATLVHGNKITEEQVGELTKQLTGKDRQWGDYMLSVFGGENWGRLNQAYIEDRNQSSRKVENYFPIRSREGTYAAIAQEIGEDLTTRAGARKAYAPRKFMIERMDIRDEHRRPMRLGATGIFFEQLEKQEHYISHWKLVKRLQRIFGDRQVAEAIAQKYGRDFNTAIGIYINEVANPQVFKAQEVRNALFDAVSANYTVGVLALNLSSLGIQLTGPLMYLADCGPLHLMTATAQYLSNPVGLTKFVWERDPQVKHVSIDPIMTEMAHRYPNEFASFRSLTARIGMKPFEIIDTATRVIGWKAVYDKNMAGKAKSDVEATEAARVAAQRATLRTQPSARGKDLPLIYKDRAAKLFLRFTRQLNQIWNMWTSDIPDDIKRGKIGHALLDATAIMVTGLMIGIMGRKRLPDDPLELATDLAGQFICSVPFVGNEVLTGLQGYWSGRGVVLLPGVVGAVGTLKKGIERGYDIEDYASAFVKMTPELMKLIGLPGVATQRVRNLVETGDPWELVGGRRE